MKALILAAGRGTRINGVLNGKNKCLTMAGDKPIIGHALDKLGEVKEIESFVIVVGYKAGTVIDYCGYEHNGRKITYVFQEELKGLVNAMECAGDSLGGEDFILHLGDEFFEAPDYAGMLKRFYHEACYSLIGTVRVNNTSLIKKTYTFSHNQEEEVCNLIEKPAQVYNNLMGTGNIMFRAGILDYISKTPVNPIRQEKDLTDLILTAIRDGNRVKFFELAKKYVNLNIPEDMEELQVWLQ
ncbi:UTP--glucose-1-phosphate uridylyltransferase [Ruminiclostridium hungatei]|uniref:UTP--glucose-1-phosphate uridylyltransferase n=1 Tax=Ruminiclostridium hungatei TaxID=48256 RepID=A0A1V4SMU2_RUMHU|nr:sugar phosphate nucleotidyltransferase [Ruminiclostridium hungatei]OPX45208.1 UTP--glucose-1-phosphate uridylyltransferase [Ruminiclostridium hungatei]